MGSAARECWNHGASILDLVTDLGLRDSYDALVAGVLSEVASSAPTPAAGRDYLEYEIDLCAATARRAAPPSESTWGDYIAALDEQLALSSYLRSDERRERHARLGVSP